MSTRHLNNPWLHRLSLLTVACTFPLIFMGGLVTSHHAGMSVPDWPNTYGYNMFLFPPRLWIGGILYEHTHRLMATVVGFVSILLTITAWKTEDRRWVRWLATSVLGAVIFQGVLGGLRVVLVKLDLAIVHACFAQAFFCLSVLMAMVTSKWWNLNRDTGLRPPRTARENQNFLQANETSTGQRPVSRIELQPGRRLCVLSVVAVSTVYAQLMIGAIMRHYNAGLAIPDEPLAYGKLIPPTDSTGLAAANHWRIFSLNLDPVTLGQIWLHFGHRIGAILVSCALLGLIGTIHVKYRERKDLVRPASILGLLLIAQLTLGILTVYLRKPADVASLHVAVGALVLATTFFIAVRAVRLYSLAYRVGGHGFQLEREDRVAEATASGV